MANTKPKAVSETKTATKAAAADTKAAAKTTAEDVKIAAKAVANDTKAVAKTASNKVATKARNAKNRAKTAVLDTAADITGGLRKVADNTSRALEETQGNLESNEERRSAMIRQYDKGFLHGFLTFTGIAIVGSFIGGKLSKRRHKQD